MTDGTGQPTLFCRRWDLLGRDLLALANTIALARCFGWEFRFVWPEGVDPYIADPTPLLAESFRRQFEFTEEDLHGRTVLPEGEIVFRDRAGIREHLAGLNEHVLVEIQDPFAIVRPLDDDPAEAARRFREAFFSIGWSDKARRLVESHRMERRRDHLGTARQGRGHRLGRMAPLHALRQVHAASLYRLQAEELSRRAGHVLALSDNAMVLAWLRHRCDDVVTAADVIPGYDGLPVMLQALADILLMSRCGSIYGPSETAFSTFAAHVGGRRVMPADLLVPPGREAILDSGIRRTEKDLAEYPFLRPFVARATSTGTSTCSATACRWESSSIWPVVPLLSIPTPWG